MAAGQDEGEAATAPLTEINVTPLVDVMLVLLIVFRVAAPLMTSGVTVDLPRASAAAISQDAGPITVPVNAEGKLYLSDAEVPLTDRSGKLLAAGVWV